VVPVSLKHQEMRRQASSSIVIPEGIPSGLGAPGGKIKLP